MPRTLITIFRTYAFLLPFISCRHAVIFFDAFLRHDAAACRFSCHYFVFAISFDYAAYFSPLRYFRAAYFAFAAFTRYALYASRHVRFAATLPLISLDCYAHFSFDYLLLISLRCRHCRFFTFHAIFAAPLLLMRCFRRLPCRCFRHAAVCATLRILLTRHYVDVDTLPLRCRCRHAMPLFRRHAAIYMLMRFTLFFRDTAAIYYAMLQAMMRAQSLLRHG